MFLCGNIELNLDLHVHNKSNVLEKCQNTGYIFYTPMCRELIFLLNGTMIYNYVTVVKALYLDNSQDLTTMTNIFKKKWLSFTLVCSKVKVSQICEIIDIM